MKTVILLSVCAIFITFGLNAHAEDEHGKVHHLHKNEVALFLGGTYNDEADKNFFTIGGENERRLNRWLGIGFLSEYVTDEDSWVVVAPLTFRAGESFGLKFMFGPGFENAKSHESEEHHHEETSEERETSFLFRAGSGYDIHFGSRCTISPQINFDFVKEHEEWQTSVVYGATLGVGF